MRRKLECSSQVSKSLPQGKKTHAGQAKAQVWRLEPLVQKLNQKGASLQSWLHAGQLQEPPNQRENVTYTQDAALGCAFGTPSKVDWTKWEPRLQRLCGGLAVTHSSAPLAEVSAFCSARAAFLTVSTPTLSLDCHVGNMQCEIKTLQFS